MVERNAGRPPPSVVCFGEVLWDLFDEAKPASKRARAAAEPVGRTFRRELGGAPANVATTLSRLGVPTSVVGGIGQDLFGDALHAHLAKDGVDTRFLVRLKERTGLTFVTRRDGEPTFLFYRHQTADVELRAEHVTPAMGRAAWALVGTSTLMTRHLAEATWRFLSVAKKAGARLVVDLNVRPNLWSSPKKMRKAIAEVVAGAAIVKGSLADLVAVSGHRDLRWLTEHAPGGAWVLTQGAKGASAMGDHGFVAAPSRPAVCVDATGAGDAFVAGVLSVLVTARAAPGSASWSDPALWALALDVGHRLGALAVSEVGAVSGIRHLGSVKARLARAAAFAEAAGPGAPASPETRRRKTT